MYYGVTIHFIEQINTREEDDHDAQEIGTEEKTDNRDSDSDGCRDGIPFFPSCQSALKCPRKRFHKKLKVIKYEIDDEPSRP